MLKEESFPTYIRNLYVQNRAEIKFFERTHTRVYINHTYIKVEKS